MYSVDHYLNSDCHLPPESACSSVVEKHAATSCLEQQLFSISLRLEQVCYWNRVVSLDARDAHDSMIPGQTTVLLIYLHAR